MNTEQWRFVPGVRGYEVSSRGRVRHRTGFLPRLLRPVRRNTGYLLVTCHGRQLAVHRLVLRAFVGRPGRGKEAAHLNGVRDDNRVENLRWVTHRENARHMMVHGRTQRGRRQWQARLSVRAVKRIRVLAERGVLTRTAIARQFGVDRCTVNDVVTRRTWAWVPE